MVGEFNKSQAIHRPVDQINDPAIAKLVYLVDKYIGNQCFP